MKYLLFFSFACLLTISASAQQEYTTAQSGPYSDEDTWEGGALGAPPATGSTCNCQIIVAPGHTLTISANLTLTNANFVLQGASSILTFSNNRSLFLLGNSSIDLQHTQATISKQTNTNTVIELGGEVIFRSNQTRFPTTAALGTVEGLASASSERADPNFTNSVLPVELSFFKATSSSGKVSLSWTTDQEINSDRFDIERSPNGQSWSVIGTVNAAGNASTPTQYSFTDLAPVNGENHYRLKMVDIDTKYEYSPISLVTVSVNALAVNAFPNPAFSVVNITVSQGSPRDFQLRMINRTGQVVHNQKYRPTSGRIAIPVVNFPEGAYFVEVTDANGAKAVRSILITRK